MSNDSNDFASNCPVSWPIKISRVKPEVDFGGLMFSYKWGPVYSPSEEPVLLRPPVR